MNIPPTYNKIMQLFSFLRGAGHTYAMLNGAVNVKSCLVIMASEPEAKRIRSQVPKTVRVVALENIDQIRGVTSPILIDHHALQVLGYDYQRTISELVAENASLKRALGES